MVPDYRKTYTFANDEQLNTIICGASRSPIILLIDDFILSEEDDNFCYSTGVFYS